MEIKFPVTKKDLKIDWFSGTGPGGQHRNKSQNCCRITHIATGISAVCQEHRERSTNQRKAFRRLANRLVAQAELDNTRERYHTTEVVRTYNKPDNRVKDYKSGFTQTYDRVFNDISDMIEERNKAVLLDEA